MNSPILFAGRVKITCFPHNQPGFEAIKARLAARGVTAEHVTPCEDKAREGVMVLMSGADLERYQEKDRRYDKLLENSFRSESTEKSLRQEITEFVLRAVNVFRLSARKKELTPEEFERVVACLQA